jgi:hypothetical protein
VREKHDEKLKQCDKVLRKVNSIWGMKRHKSEIREKIYIFAKGEIVDEISKSFKDDKQKERKKLWKEKWHTQILLSFLSYG